MKSELKSKKLVILGKATAATLGAQIVGNPEPHSFYTLGLSDR